MGDAAVFGGDYWNKTPHTLFYTPDLSRPAYNDIKNRDGSVRLTWQAAAEHKVTFSTSHQRNGIWLWTVEQNKSPEASWDLKVSGVFQSLSGIPILASYGKSCQ